MISHDIFDRGSTGGGPFATNQEEIDPVTDDVVIAIPHDEQGHRWQI
jgi:hypothetical protein